MGLYQQKDCRLRGKKKKQDKIKSANLCYPSRKGKMYSKGDSEIIGALILPQVQSAWVVAAGVWGWGWGQGGLHLGFNQQDHYPAELHRQPLQRTMLQCGYCSYTKGGKVTPQSHEGGITPQWIKRIILKLLYSSGIFLAKFWSCI